jgi:molybdopterin-containing oxidoreductase family iron-sulfur binding subunit
MSEVSNGKWGMVINLDTCNGCQACVTACAFENNLPSVGYESAGYGRSMHWMRIIRKWEGEYPHIRATFQPVMCQQCGSAPCEPVCPAFATQHSQAEEINLQIYNRCIGTRYCANNCPYTARVFNWFDWEYPEPMASYLNPDVTVRGRGVMEKCTFCVQRIRKGEEGAKVEGRDVRDGEVVPACAQACPTQAIVFGDFSDPESKASKLAESQRGFRMEEQLGTQPRVVYLQGLKV